MEIIKNHEKAKEETKQILRRINKGDYKDAIYWTSFLIQTLITIIEAEEINGSKNNPGNH